MRPNPITAILIVPWAAFLLPGPTVRSAPLFKGVTLSHMHSRSRMPRACSTFPPSVCPRLCRTHPSCRDGIVFFERIAGDVGSMHRTSTGASIFASRPAPFMSSLFFLSIFFYCPPIPPPPLCIVLLQSTVGTETTARHLLSQTGPSSRRSIPST
ncbi:hypothetical protein EDD21DRAFT_375722 [Dissophora ornata]|nr:hypothetical protein EDD21DRAFT_375722 [Dissophora ornata]